MSKRTLVLIIIVASVITAATAVYTFMPRNSFDRNLSEKLAVNDMTYSKSYGWVFAKTENYNGEFVLYIEGLHRVVYAVPVQGESDITGKPDIVIRMGEELRIYGNLMVYGGKRYTIVEYGAYTLPLWVSASISSGEVRAFTSLSRELIGVDYEAFPILDAISQYRVASLTISPYPNYFIDVTECRVYDNIVEYLVSGGASVVFHADTMEFAYSSDPEIDRSYRGGGPYYSEDDV